MNRLCKVFVISIAFALITSSAEAQTDLTCTTTEECLTFIGNSVCVSGKCSCQDGQILSSDEGRCLLPAEDYESPCEDNAQCVARLSTGGTCSDNKCICADGFHYLKGFCWKDAGLNEPCYQKEQCYGGYEYIGFDCVNNKCQCREGFYERYTACRRIMHEGEVCSVDDDCRCENGAEPKCGTTCSCGGKHADNKKTEDIDEEEYLEVEYNVTPNDICQPGTFGDTCKLELGMECTDTTECSVSGGPKSSCYEGICSCIATKAGPSGQQLISQLFVPSRNNRRCQRTYSDLTTRGCTENAQCAVFGSNAICEDTFCKCTDTSHWLEEEKFCWPTTKLGDECKSEKDCYSKTGLVECTGTPSICSCQQGYHPRDDDCFLEATHVGEDCSLDEDCVFDNGKCDSGTKKCICADHYFENNKLCIAALNSPCERDNQCSHIQHAYCNTEGKYCDCKENFVSSENEEYCLPVVNYSGECVETVQCNEEMGKLKECINGMCLCNATAHYYNGKCYETKSLEEKCSNKIECLNGQDPNSIVCLNGKCACQYDYERNSENKCVKDGDSSSGKFEFSILLILTMAFLSLGNTIRN